MFMQINLDFSQLIASEKNVDVGETKARETIKIKKIIFHALDNIVRHNACWSNNKSKKKSMWAGKTTKLNDNRREKAERKVFLIIHKNLDEFVTFRHLRALKIKLQWAEMVMDKLKVRKKLKSVLIR
jgi:hypothetical protein